MIEEFELSQTSPYATGHPTGWQAEACPTLLEVGLAHASILAFAR